MKIIHYSSTGYNGDMTYTSVCGKVVRTHRDKEGSSIYPDEATCPDCLQTIEYKEDIKKETPIGVKRRIYIESDILPADEFRSAQREVASFAKDNGDKCVRRVFSEVLDFAWHDLEKTWIAVRGADEIYANSSLMPLVGDSYTGAPVIFDGMCARAIKEKITGKSVIILNALENVMWDYVDKKLMKEAFKNNKLFMYDEDYENLVEVDVTII